MDKLYASPLGLFSTSGCEDASTAAVHEVSSSTPLDVVQAARSIIYFVGEATKVQAVKTLSLLVLCRNAVHNTLSIRKKRHLPQRWKQQWYLTGTMSPIQALVANARSSVIFVVSPSTGRLCWQGSK